MKKTLIASTIAATLSVSAFASDEHADAASKLSSLPTLYGTIELTHVTTDDDVTTEHEFEDNGSTIGIKHEHAVSEGVTAFLKAEFEFGADDAESSNGIDTLDEAYIGLRGDFGSVQVGSDETVYDWVDILDTSEFLGIGEVNEFNEGDNFQYVSPVLAGGLTLGVTAPIDSDTTFGGALAAKYAMDNLEVVLGYAIGRDDGGANASIEEGDTIGLAITFTMDELALLGQFETQDEVDNNDDGEDLWGLMGMYTMGQNVFALGFQSRSFDANAKPEDENSIYVQALHNLSDNAYIYLEFLSQTDVDGVNDSDLDTLAVGATYKF